MVLRWSRERRGSYDRGSNTVADKLFAGGMAGIASWLASYPFDVVKSVMQVCVFPGLHVRVHVRVRTCVRFCAAFVCFVMAPTPPIALDSVCVFVCACFGLGGLRCAALQARPLTAGPAGAEGGLSLARSIVRLKGVRGLFAGLGVCLLPSFPANAVGFLVYELVVAQMLADAATANEL